MMRRGTKSTLIDVLKKETGVDMCNGIQSVTDTPTAVIVDAMHLIHKCSFLKGEKFDEMSQRLMRKMLHDIPGHTVSLHFCCDRYDRNDSLKSNEREHRKAKSRRTSKRYEIKGNMATPPFKEFMSSPENKQELQHFICEHWSETYSEDPDLYISGGFMDEAKAIVVSDGVTLPVVDLECSHEEADTRILLHAVYSVLTLGAQRIVVYANDTDVIVMCIYYTLKYNIPEMWVRTEPGLYLPVHELVRKLSEEDINLLPFLHALSGKDDTSYLANIGKSKMWKAHKEVDCSPLACYANEAPYDELDIPEALTEQAKKVVLFAYNGSHCQSLKQLRGLTFLTGNGTLLRLPPTDDAFEQHVKRACLSTIIAKSAHLPASPSINYEDYGWKKDIDGFLRPVSMTLPPWPENLPDLITCKCEKGCNTTCKCKANREPCFIGCKCLGNPECCVWTRSLLGEDSNEVDDSDDDA